MSTKVTSVFYPPFHFGYTSPAGALNKNFSGEFKVNDWQVSPTNKYGYLWQETKLFNHNASDMDSCSTYSSLSAGFNYNVPVDCTMLEIEYAYRIKMGAMSLQMLNEWGVSKGHLTGEMELDWYCKRGSEPALRPSNIQNNEELEKISKKIEVQHWFDLSVGDVFYPDKSKGESGGANMFWNPDNLIKRKRFHNLTGAASSWPGSTIKVVVSQTNHFDSSVDDYSVKAMLVFSCLFESISVTATIGEEAQQEKIDVSPSPEPIKHPKPKPLPEILTINRFSKEIHRPECKWAHKIAFYNKGSIRKSQVPEYINFKDYDGCYYCLNDYHTK